MPNPAPAPADILAAVREHTEQSWRVFSQVTDLRETLTTWTTTTAPDGRPILSAEVTGPEAAHALKTFASTYHLALHHPGDLRPQVDVTVTDRAVLYWRCDGVWVELWHPNPATPAPVPVPVVPVPVEDALPAPQAATPTASPLVSALRGLGDRLPYTRRSKKETSRA